MCGASDALRYMAVKGDYGLKGLTCAKHTRISFSYFMAENQCVALGLYIDNLIIKDTEYALPWNMLL